MLWLFCAGSVGCNAEVLGCFLFEMSYAFIAYELKGIQVKIECSGSIYGICFECETSWAFCFSMSFQRFSNLTRDGKLNVKIYFSKLLWKSVKTLLFQTAFWYIICINVHDWPLQAKIWNPQRFSCSYFNCPCYSIFQAPGLICWNALLSPHPDLKCQLKTP